MVKRIAAALGIALVVLIAIIVFNTIIFTAEEDEAIALVTHKVNVEQAAQRLGEAVRFETDSTKRRSADFPRFIAWLEETYPTVHTTMERQLISNQTPLFRWAGMDASLKPVLLAAHYDVVPVPKASLPDWVHPPYAGMVDENFVWGRGTLDDKGAVIALMEAAEAMIAEGFQPKRDVWFSFGHDEEVGGIFGAGAVARKMRTDGVQFAWILDEGSFVLDDIIPGLERPIASINVAEKGTISIELVAKGAGGHSSMPPKQTAVGTLARAVDRLQNNPVPGGLDGVTADFFDRLGREFGLPERALFANTWLFGPLLENQLAKANTTNAMLRTTTAPTMLEGSPKVNVLPVEARAGVNFRLHPRDSADSLLTHVEEAIDDGEITIIKPENYSEASTVSDADASGYLAIEKAIRQTFGNVATVPGLTIAATDARHYGRVADNAYRINPFQIEDHDLARFHGTNERLSKDNLRLGISFYRTLLEAQ
jgi:carboxypeptidase PM20D1